MTSDQLFEGRPLAAADASAQPDAGLPVKDWVLRRNCSLGPRQLLAVFGSIAVVSFGLGIFWAVQGAWVVLPFALMQSAALTFAFVFYARQVSDFDRVSLFEDRIEVELRRGRRVQSAVLPRAWVRLEQTLERPEHYSLIRIRSGRQEARVGEFVEPAARLDLYRDMRRHFIGNLG